MSVLNDVIAERDELQRELDDLRKRHLAMTELAASHAQERDRIRGQVIEAERSRDRARESLGEVADKVAGLKNSAATLSLALETLAKDLPASIGTVGSRSILEERSRQIKEEGWTLEHDQEHEFGELAWAAACYAAPGEVYRDNGSTEPASGVNEAWPFDPEWDKRPGPRCTVAERVRALTKAGALCAAEIDRLTAPEGGVAS